MLFLVGYNYTEQKRRPLPRKTSALLKNELLTARVKEFCVTYATRRSYRPGETVPVSGQYALIDPYGRNTGREVTCVKGEVFPPAPVAGCTYVLADRTKHRY